MNRIFFKNAEISLCEFWYFCCVLSSFKYCDYLTTWIPSSGRSTVVEPNILKTWTKIRGIQAAVLFLHLQRELCIQYIVFWVMFLSLGWMMTHYEGGAEVWFSCHRFILHSYCYILRFGKGSPYGSGFAFAYMGNAKSIARMNCTFWPLLSCLLLLWTRISILLNKMNRKGEGSEIMF